LTCQGLFAAAIPPLICASGGAVGTVDLRVASPSTRNTVDPLPLRTIGRLEEGDTIRYKPVLRPHEERKGDVTLVLVPADKKAAGRDKVLIFDPRTAAHPQQWTVPWRASLAAFIYGPSGLSVRKVEAFLDKDDELIGELADYADKTAKAEALIAALSSNDSSREAVSSVLRGFSSQFGVGSELTRTAPLDQQAMVLFRTLNPAIASYDPLAGQGSQPMGQTAGLATSVAEMFFGSPVGLAAGGTAMLLNLRALAFPRSEFRSAFSEAMPEEALGLCGKVGAPAVHTRIAYLWAVRIPNVPAPHLAVGKANSLAAGIKAPLPLTGQEADWKFLDRARSWQLTPDHGKPVPVKVQVLASSQSVELALDKNIPPGRYSLGANWDWDRFPVAGSIDVRPLADFTKVKLTAATQDRLMPDCGKVPLALEGADFEFVTKVEIKRLNDAFASAGAVPFLLPKGLREGVQERMDIQADTSGLQAGPYQLIVWQVDGKSHEVRVNVLPPPPALEGLPLSVNQDVSTRSFDLKGKRLDLLERVELAHGTATLGAASADGTERSLTVKLAPGLAAGTEIPLRATVVNRSEPLIVAAGVRVVGPRPVIKDVRISHVPAQSVHLDAGELPGPLTLTAMLRVAHLPPGSSVRLECEQTLTGALTLRPGEAGRDAHLEQLTSDELFVTLHTGAWINGCRLQATVTGTTGESEPRQVGTIVVVPAIEQLNLAPDSAGADLPATVIGRNLETIEKAGWTPDQGTPVAELPQPEPGDAFRQRLELRLAPPPAPDAVLYLWLSGETRARVTNVRAN
jgi:hypothetical protein